MARPTDRYAAQNRRARHNYLITETIEAGIMLVGSEVKVLRKGSVSINEAYAAEREGALYLMNAQFPEYAAARVNHEPRRPRKLLVHKKELDKLLGAVTRERMTLVPLALYFNERGRAKVELGLAKGKRKEDMRQAEKDREWQRAKGRIMRAKNA
jgi:SsrA-binding protein